MGKVFFVFATTHEAVVLATLTEAAYERLKRWRKSFQQMEQSEPIGAITYTCLPEAVFELIVPRVDALDRDTAEMFECVQAEGATYQLVKELDPAVYTAIDSDLIQLIVNKDGVAFLFLTAKGYRGADLVTWNELGISNEDPKRCRYTDCEEEHPVAGEDELVTCHTCRRDLGLPVEGEEN